MKFLILASAAAVTLSGAAMASEHIGGQVSLGAGALVMTHAPQSSVAAIKLAMGPTSAPQKPGGVGKGQTKRANLTKRPSTNTRLCET
jgi:opacity protein-like surface antigen